MGSKKGPSKQERDLIRQQEEELQRQEAAAQREREQAAEAERKRISAIVSGKRGRRSLLSAGYGGFVADEGEEGKRLLGTKR